MLDVLNVAALTYVYETPRVLASFDAGDVLTEAQASSVVFIIS